MEFIYGLWDGWTALIVAILNAFGKDNYGFFDPQRSGDFWYRFGFIEGAWIWMGWPFAIVLSGRRRK